MTTSSKEKPFKIECKQICRFFEIIHQLSFCNLKRVPNLNHVENLFLVVSSCNSCDDATYRQEWRMCGGAFGLWAKHGIHIGGRVYVTCRRRSFRLPAVWSGWAEMDVLVGHWKIKFKNNFICKWYLRRKTVWKSFFFKFLNRFVICEWALFKATSLIFKILSSVLFRATYGGWTCQPKTFWSHPLTMKWEVDAIMLYPDLSCSLIVCLPFHELVNQQREITTS